jgi:regulator of replication initiation timing
MFKGSEDTVDKIIRNDFAYSPIPELRQCQQELHNENAELTRKNSDLKRRNSEEESRALRLAQEIERKQHALDAIKEQAQRIANG